MANPDYKSAVRDISANCEDVDRDVADTDPSVAEGHPSEEIGQRYVVLGSKVIQLCLCYFEILPDHPHCLEDLEVRDDVGIPLRLTIGLLSRVNPLSRCSRQ